MNLGSPSTTAAELGDFKCETHDAGYNYYDKAFFFGRKNYALVYTQDGVEKFKYKSKGIPKKFASDDLVRLLIAKYETVKPLLLYQPFNVVVPLDIKVPMEVWRKGLNDDGGVTIKNMLKNINIITDRVMEAVDKVGYPQKTTTVIEL